MLGVADDVSIHTLDPVELLEAGGDDASTGGTLLLKAQQIFAVINAVAALAEELAWLKTPRLARHSRRSVT